MESTIVDFYSGNPSQKSACHACASLLGNGDELRLSGICILIEWIGGTKKCVGCGTGLVNKLPSTVNKF